MSWIHEMFDVPEDKIEQFEAYCEFEEAMERGNQEEPKESSLSYQEGKGKETDEERIEHCI